MNAILNEKAIRSKLLAAVLAMALIAVCGIVVLSDSTAYAEESEATQEIGYTTGETTATVYSAEQLRTVLTDADATYSAVTTIVIGGPFTVDHVITVNKNITIDGNDQTITAVKSATFTGEYKTGAGATNKVISIENTDATIIDLTIDNAKFAFGLNVYGKGTNGVTIENVVSNNSAGAGFVFGSDAVVSAENISATGYLWGGVNADKGATVKIDTIDTIGSIYTENSTGVTKITDLEGNALESNVEIGIGTSGQEKYFNGYYTSVDEAAAAYTANNKNNADATIEINADVELTADLTIASKTTMTIADGVNFANSAEMTVNGTVTGDIDNTDGVINSGTTAKYNNSTVSGGEFNVETLTDANLPVFENGTVFNNTASSLSYTTYTYATAQGVEIIVGVPTVTYNDVDYGGYTVTAIPLKATDVSGNNVAIDSHYAYQGMNHVYAKSADAVEGNTNYGNCIDAGTYYVNIGLSVTLENYGATPVEFVTEFTILPQTLTGLTLNGPDNQTIGKQAYLGGEPVTLVYGEDVYLYQNGVVSDLVYGDDFELSYRDNTAVGKATVYVIFTGNYTADAEVSATFQIVQGIATVDATPKDGETMYEGELIDKNAFDFTGTYENGAAAPTIDVDNITIVDAEHNPVTGAYYDADSTIVYFAYEANGQTVYGQVEVQVVAIESVEVADVNADSPYDTTYQVGDVIDTYNMAITVTYVDEEYVIFNDVTDDGVINFTPASSSDALNTTAFTTEFAFSPETFDSVVGDVEVTVDYCGATAVITVTVDGFIATYMVNDEVYGTQVGLSGDFAAIFNYVGDIKGFSGWMVGETGAIYQPGDMYKFGEDANMWADGTVTFYAKFGSSGGITPGEPASEVKIYINVYDDSSVEIVLLGVDGTVPTGINVQITYTYLTENAFGEAYETKTIDVPYTYEGGESFVIIDVDMNTLAGDYYSTISGLRASAVVGETSIQTNGVQFTPIAA